MPADLVTLFRHFRHDLLNQLQLLSGHLQLGRTHEVLHQDVQSMIERIQEVSQVFACQDEPLSLLLWNFIELARQDEITTSFDLLVELPQPANASLLLAASRHLQAMQQQILRMDEEEQWWHLRLDAQTGSLVVTTPAISEIELDRTGLEERLCRSFAADGEMQFVLPLLAGDEGTESLSPER